MLIAHFILKILKVTLKRKSKKKATTKIQCIQKSHKVQKVADCPRNKKSYLQGNFFFMGTHVNNLYARNMII